jgi:hypothetical protein
MICIAIVLIISGAFQLVRLIPVGRQSGILTLHYNVYLGIDEVGSWPWVFAFIGGAIGLAIIDVLFAFGLFLRDPLASRTLLVITLLTLILWSVGSFFLVSVNI